MAYNWRILRAAVEQEILFPSMYSYKEYIDSMKRKGMPYEVIGEHERLDGSVVVLMRKRYNPMNPFLESQPAGDRYTGEEVQAHG